MKLKNCSNCGTRFEYKGRHGNRNKNFFCIENIVILSKLEHAKIHAAGKERDRFGRFVKAKSDA